MTKESTSLEELHEFWSRQFDAVVEAAKDRTPEQVADAMLTIAVTRMMEHSDPKKVGRHLAMIAASMYHVNKVQDAPDPPSIAMH